MAADFLTLQDLYNLVGTERVQQYFDDDIDGDITDNNDAVVAVLEAAEGFMYGYLLKAYGDKASIITLVQNDPSLVSHCAWVALEFAYERRPEFLNDEGKGIYWAQQERAKELFLQMSRGKRRSQGEATAGENGQVGGAMQPTLEEGQARFTFCGDQDNPRGHGSF